MRINHRVLYSVYVHTHCTWYTDSKAINTLLHQPPRWRQAIHNLYIVVSVNWLQTISFLGPSHVSTGYRPPTHASPSSVSSHSSLYCLPGGLNAPSYCEFPCCSSVPASALSLHETNTREHNNVRHPLASSLFCWFRQCRVEMPSMQGKYRWDKLNSYLTWHVLSVNQD